ncbi:MAG TPA: DUF2752 domain-containing protein [Planctomycetaceae bacterium]|nr:DUF2752 domain-containing protein [Planctomycetaceae bacterium]
MCPQHVSDPDISIRPVCSGRATEPLTGYERTMWAGGAVFILVVFAVAFVLTPSPSGIGTHEQLGLPRCSFRLLTGLPCPSCGMTTSFAWFVRGEFRRAFACHIGGTLLAAAAALAVPVCLVVAAVGKRGWLRPLGRLAVGVLILVACVSLIQWAIRLWLASPFLGHL